MYIRAYYMMSIETKARPPLRHGGTHTKFSIVLKTAMAHSKLRRLLIRGSGRISGSASSRASSSRSLKPLGDTTMSTITKTMLMAALLVGLAPAAYARGGGTQPDLPRYGWATEQERAYSASAPDWSNRTANPNGAANAYAQQPRGRVTPGTTRPQRVIRDDPPGSAWQDRGIREDLGYPTR